MAVGINKSIFEKIKKDALSQTRVLGEERGVYPDSEGFSEDKRRNSHLLAIAPNANSSIIACTSPSIEPLKANAYTHRTRLGSSLVKNKYLEEMLKDRVPDSELQSVWSKIITSEGSVQHLDILSDWEKEIFKTAFEINQEWVVQHAADRQEFICQGQSVNLFFPAGSEKSYVMKVHLQAWKQGLKGLYYLRTSSSVDADKINTKMQRASLADYAGSDEEECLACHS
jgi:ribonucleoside-diphosphate reductase alpha chain